MKTYKSPIVSINGYDVNSNTTMKYTGDNDLDIEIMYTNIINYINENCDTTKSTDVSAVIYSIRNIPKIIYEYVLLYGRSAGDIYVLILANSISEVLKLCNISHSINKLYDFISQLERTTQNCNK